MQISTASNPKAASNPYKRSEWALRRIRSKIFDYPESEEPRAKKVLLYLKERTIRGRRIERESASRGPYSGLTQSELRRTGTCEADWF